MQLGRILRLIEEAYGQDSLIDAKQLSLLCTPPTSLRSRLQDVKDLGIWAPVRGMSRKTENVADFSALRTCSKLTFLMETCWKHADQWAMQRKFTLLLSKFAAVALDQERQKRNHRSRETAMAGSGKGVSERFWNGYLAAPRPSVQERQPGTAYAPNWKKTMSYLPLRLVVRESSMKSWARYSLTVQMAMWSTGPSHLRSPQEKPLEECKLVPVKLSLLAEDDQPTSDNRDLNRLSEIKYGRALRYATEAKFAGGYLTYADLSYLMGIHPEAIRRLVNLNKNVVIPLRGAQCDIGRGVTHKRKIIELYLQMYTETGSWLEQAIPMSPLRTTSGSSERFGYFMNAAFLRR